MEEDMNELIPNEIGIWIECCVPTCRKWRYVPDIDDPLMVPEKWYCYMNSDRSTNTCSTPECQELPENEVFVESKFKAGSIVWAKIIGYPWWPAMVDYCPDFQRYYWFDKPDSNVPTQYHVKFFGHKKQLRGWIRSNFIKPLIGNDKVFALEAKIRGKKLTFQQRGNILTNYKIAQSALPLTISQRLKKYSHDSWEISQRLRNQFNNGKLQSPIVPIPSDSGNSVDEADRRSDNKRKTESRNAEKFFGDKSLRKKNAENLSHKNVNEGRSEMPVKLYQSDSTTTYSSTDTWTRSTATTYKDSEDLNDTERDNSGSFPAKNDAEKYLGNSLLNSIEKHGINGKERKEIKKNDEVKIIKIMKNKKAKILALDKKLFNDNNRENERIEIEEEPEIIPDSPQPGPSKLSLELESSNEKRKKNGRSKKERKSRLERLSRYDNCVIEESRYLKALARFSTTTETSIVQKQYPIKTKTKAPSVVHTLPEWFYNADLRREEEAQSFSKLFSELSKGVEREIKREMKESVLSEISALSSISSLEGNTIAKSQLNPKNTPNNILTSDDDSFS